MRTIDSATDAALQQAPDKGLRARDMISFTVRNFDGTGAIPFAFWGDVDPIDIDVLDGLTGAADTITYSGDGGLVSMDRIPLTSDLSQRTVRVNLSQLNSDVADMIHGHDCRIAPVQIHRALFDPQTNELVGTPVCHFVGKINKAPINTAAINGESDVEVQIVSTTAELTRTNAAKKSDATQQLRSGDRFRRWNSPATVEVWWGQSRKTNG